MRCICKSHTIHQQSKEIQHQPQALTKYQLIWWSLDQFGYILSLWLCQHLNCVDQCSMFHWHCTVRGSLEMVGREGGKSALAILVCPSPGVSPLWVEAEGGARLKHFHLTLLTQQHEQILMIQWWNQSNNWSIKVFFTFWHHLCFWQHSSFNALSQVYNLSW